MTYPNREPSRAVLLGPRRLRQRCHSERAPTARRCRRSERRHPTAVDSGPWGISRAWARPPAARRSRACRTARAQLTRRPTKDARTLPCLTTCWRWTKAPPPPARWCSAARAAPSRSRTRPTRPGAGLGGARGGGAGAGAHRAAAHPYVSATKLAGCWTRAGCARPGRARELAAGTIDSLLLARPSARREVCRTRSTPQRFLAKRRLRRWCHPSPTLPSRGGENMLLRSLMHTCRRIRSGPAVPASPGRAGRRSIGRARPGTRGRRPSRRTASCTSGTSGRPGCRTSAARCGRGRR